VDVERSKVIRKALYRYVHLFDGHVLSTFPTAVDESLKALAMVNRRLLGLKVAPTIWIGRRRPSSWTVWRSY
jgi:hypothetical protein